MRVSALITNYNTWEMVRRCAWELERWSGRWLEHLLIVDDASATPPPPDLPPRVCIVRNARNLGYVESVNIGFSRLNEEIVLLLDSDAYPMMDLVNKTVEHFQQSPRLGALGFKLIGENRQETGAATQIPTALGLLIGQRLEEKWLARTRLPGPALLFSCALAVRRSAFEAIGGFDGSFDFLDADLDFSLRLIEHGWQLYRDTSLVAFHAGSGSPQTTAKRVQRFHANRWRFLRKHRRLPLPRLLKLGLGLRHAIELTFLKTCGQKIFTQEHLCDKIAGRRALLRLVWKGYGNDA